MTNRRLRESWAGTFYLTAEVDMLEAVEVGKQHVDSYAASAGGGRLQLRELAGPST